MLIVSVEIKGATCEVYIYIFSNLMKGSFVKKMALAAGNRNKDVDLSEAGRQVEQSLALFRMLLHKLAEHHLYIVPGKLYYIKKSSRLFPKQTQGCYF